MKEIDISKSVMDKIAPRLKIQYRGGGLSHVLPPFSTGNVQLMTTTSISCLSPMPGIAFSPRCCLIGDETVFMNPGEVWVFPAGTTRCFPEEDAGHLSEWVHLDFLLEPDWDLLSFFRIGRCFTGETAVEMLQLMRKLSRGRVEIFQDGHRHEVTAPGEADLAQLCAEQQAKFRLLELLLSSGEPLPIWHNFLLAYLEFSPLLQWIMETPYPELSLESMAAFCNLSRSGFEKRFRRSFGISPGQYLYNYRLSASEKLLISTELSCSEIAELSGYSSVFAFSRAFQNRYGTSPQHYRKKTIRIP